MKDLKVGMWYVDAYPMDECGKDIRKDITFGDLFNCLKDGNDFYSFCGAYDSIVRERVFAKIADIFNVPYDFIYGMWIEGD